MAKQLNDESIATRVAEVMSKFPAGHTRHEVYEAIRDAEITDTKGEPIKPSVYYHSLAYTKKADGQTIMEKLYPDWKPTDPNFKRTTVRKTRVAAKPAAKAVTSQPSVPHLAPSLDDFNPDKEMLNKAVEITVRSLDNLIETAQRLKDKMGGSTSRPERSRPVVVSNRSIQEKARALAAH